MPLTVGDKAPDFTAVVQNPDGTETITLSKILEAGQKVLLIFYPGDDTPGCTTQLCGVRDVYTDYQKHNVKVLGVNPANEQSHLKFIAKFSYPFGIVVDADKTIRESYGAIGKFFANIVTKRCVFLIDTDGTIIFQHNGQQDNQEIFKLLESKS
jgi:thioredoxin-dependent peroxiredoxin